jgi:hypothetical protein
LAANDPAWHFVINAKDYFAATFISPDLAL